MTTHASLAEEWQVNARPITELKEALTEADVLFTTSGAPFTILAREDVAPIMKLRPDRPLCIVDIAMPRDIDPAVGEIPGVCLHDLDDLQHVIEDELRGTPALTSRRWSASSSTRLALFWADYQARAVAPTIRLLREHAEQLRQAELSWALQPPAAGLRRGAAADGPVQPPLDEQNAAPVHPQSESQSRQEDGALVAAVARDLFGLEETV